MGFRVGLRPDPPLCRAARAGWAQSIAVPSWSTLTEAGLPFPPYPHKPGPSLPILILPTKAVKVPRKAEDASCSGQQQSTGRGWGILADLAKAKHFNHKPKRGELCVHGEETMTTRHHFAHPPPRVPGTHNQHLHQAHGGLRWGTMEKEKHCPQRVWEGVKHPGSD